VPKRSAGLLVYRRTGSHLELLLVHPGGPYWAGKDEGAWSIPKGELDDGEDGLVAAAREFEEELGSAPPDVADAVPLGEVRQAGGKVVSAWGLEGDLDVDTVVSGTFEMEWPPRSGRTAAFPEVDRAAWFDVDGARRALLRGQLPFVDRVLEVVATPRG
jgi:predicted NUDIX family NTP pyrophosphohydrolase